MVVRLADPAIDAPAVTEIYRPVVEGSHISFEEIPPDAVEMERRMRHTLDRMPWLVVDVEGEVGGYAYAAPHRERPAYRWSVDISVYLAVHHRGRGLGRLLYEELVELLSRQGFANVFAGIALPNPTSEALHRSIGMRPVGIYEGVGFKLGKWWDVAWYGMRLIDADRTTSEPIPLPLLP